MASRASEALGLNSLRGRLVLTIALFAGFIIVTTGIVENHIGAATQRGVVDATDKQQVSTILRAVTDEMWSSAYALHGYMDTVDTSLRATAIGRIERAMEKSELLLGNACIQRSPESVTHAQSLLQRLGQLRDRMEAGPESAPPARKAEPAAHRHVPPTYVQAYFSPAWDSLHALEKAVDDDVGGDLQTLARTIDKVLRSYWLVALIGVATLLMGFLLFERTVRKPIVRITQALKAEADGAKEISLPLARTQETANLISAFDHMRQQVRSRQQRLETILDNAAEGIITFDAEGCIESFNMAAENLFGYTQDEVAGKDLRLILPPQTRENREDYLNHFIRTEIRRLIGHEGEVTGRHKDGTTFPMALKISAMMLDGKQLYTGLVADISERKAMLENLRNMAEHDGLTGLYNRSYFQQELERVVERVKRAGGVCCSLLYIDLDNFKYVNDTLGHAAGDRVIIEIAGILNKRARKSDLIARIGGDEFTVLLFDATPALSVQVAESFRAKLADYIFRHSKEQIDIGCSIGITGISPATASAAEVLSQADLACHLAKRGGRNRVHLYNPADAESVAAMTLDMGWSRRIKEAIEKDRFVLACQPIVSTATRDVECYEVLIRMLDERNELIMPSGFLATADRFGLAAEIDKWVIRHAIEGLARQRVTSPRLRYAINLSGRTLTTPGICELIQDRLKDTGLDPAALTFEVTETVAIADMAAAENFLHRLRSMGCRTALDDFGSGMASFAYLKDLPVNSVKIDGRFVKNLAASPVDQAMVKAMNEIAHALGKTTIAEFVENEESFKLLAAWGVDYAQGYHLGRPDVTLPCEALTRGRCAG